MIAPLHALGALGVVAVAAGCATPYAYRFQITGPGAHVASTSAEHDSLEDEDLKAAFQWTGGALSVELTNKTDDVIQVGWDKVVLDRGDGTRSALRPDVDLGWIAAGARVTARLVPVALPRMGKAAEAYEGRKLELDLPAVVRHEPRLYRFHFVAHVQPE